MKTARHLFIIFVFNILIIQLYAQNKIVVFQTDFGLKDGAVSAMKGVAMSVSPDLKLFDLTHAELMKLLHARARRHFARGSTSKASAKLLKRLRQAKKDAPENEKNRDRKDPDGAIH